MIAKFMRLKICLNMNAKTDREDRSCDDIAFLSEIIANFMYWQKSRDLRLSNIPQWSGDWITVDQLEQYYHLVKKLGITGRLPIDENLRLAREDCVSDRVEFLNGVRRRASKRPLPRLSGKPAF
jgi:hypothetical protein